MIEPLYSFLLPTVIAFCASIFWYRFLRKYSTQLGLIDTPDHRKVHSRLVPVMGGLMIACSIITAALVCYPLGYLLTHHKSLTLGVAIILTIGVLDDRKGLSLKLRFALQIFCAWLIAHHNFRLHSLYGFMGINDIPEWAQYALTIVLITGLTNAFNLIDGIDGLAGSVALINLFILSIACVITGVPDWLCLTLPLMAALCFFLKVNRYPAKIFMGDGGSMTLGFLMATLGVMLVERSYIIQAKGYNSSIFIVVIAACFMLPVIDALRVFSRRMYKGFSPLTPDKTHLHHKLLKLSLLHSTVTKRLVGLHLFVIMTAMTAINFLNISTVLLMEVAIVAVYTLSINFTYIYNHWFRFIKKFERG